MTAQDMYRLRMQLQQRYGMTEAEAAVAVDLLASPVGRVPAMEREMDRMLVDMAGMRTALTRIEAAPAAMAERRRHAFDIRRRSARATSAGLPAHASWGRPRGMAR